MSMTHYMELLAVNQPWNLLIFMAVPVILAETLAISELYLLYTRNYDGSIRRLNRWTGIAVGLYFLGVFVYLTATAVVPLTQTGAWRGLADVLAVGFYLAGVVPLFGITLLEWGVFGRNKTEHQRMAAHAALVGVFLVVAHIAMIFGMLDPALLSGGADATAMPMHGMH